MTLLQSTAPLTRLVAILLFIGLPVLLATSAALNMLDAADRELQIAESRMQSAALMRRAQGQAERQDLAAVETLYVLSATRTGAVAELQQRLVTLIADAGGQVIETAAVAAGPEKPQDWIAVRATLDIDNDGLLTLLYHLESGVPLVTVDTLSLRRSVSDTVPETLRAEIAVRARWKAGMP